MPPPAATPSAWRQPNPLTTRVDMDEEAAKKTAQWIVRISQEKGAWVAMSLHILHERMLAEDREHLLRSWQREQFERGERMFILWKRHNWLYLLIRIASFGFLKRKEYPHLHAQETVRLAWMRDGVGWLATQHLISVVHLPGNAELDRCIIFPMPAFIDFVLGEG